MVKVTLLQERLVPGLKENPAQQKMIILSTVSSNKRHVRSKIEIAEFKPFLISHLQSLEMVFVQQALSNLFLSVSVRMCVGVGVGGGGVKGMKGE